MIERENVLRTAIAPVLGLAVCSVICVASVELRTARTHDPSYRFLDWNLFLAWIPLVLAFGVYEAARRRHVFTAAGLGLLWLLFFPNAPYLVTDFIHLRGPSAAPLWFDSMMLTAFASTGLLLGFLSLYVIHAVLREAADARLAWIGALGALVLASFGIYLGRVVALNSWDALLHPLWIVRVVLADNELHPHPGEFLLLATCGLAAGYLFFFVATRLCLLAAHKRFTPRDQLHPLAGRSELSDWD